MSGNCNETCTTFLEGLCNEGINIINDLSIDTVEELYLEHEDEFRIACLEIVNPKLNKRNEVIRLLQYE